MLNTELKNQKGK